MKPADIHQGCTYRTPTGFDLYVTVRNGTQIFYRCENRDKAGTEGQSNAIDFAGRVKLAVPNYVPVEARGR